MAKWLKACFHYHAESFDHLTAVSGGGLNHIRGTYEISQVPLCGCARWRVS